MIINSKDGAPMLDGADRKALWGKNRRKENCGKKTVDRKPRKQSHEKKTVGRKLWKENYRNKTVGKKTVVRKAREENCQELYDPNIMTKHSYQAKDPEMTEPEILILEIEQQ